MKRIYTYTLLAIVATVFLLMAFLNSGIHRLNDESNGFKRTIKTFSVTKLYEKHFDQSITDIAGVTSDRIFIATSQPDKIITTDKYLSNEKLIPLNITPDTRLRSGFTTQLSFPYLYILGSNVPAIIKYNLTTDKEAIYPVKRAFSRGAFISPSSVVIRGFNKDYNDANLQKLNLLSGKSVEENGITDKTGSGGYITDGLLNFDPETNTIIFNHFFSNKILYLDTNLNLLCKKTAIDTFNTYTAKARTIATDKNISFSFASPPKLLSLYSCVNKGRLFIYSRVKADNETTAGFMGNAVVDVYDIRLHQYKGSYYIPTEQGKRMAKFKVFDNWLIALYNKSVVVYLIQ